MSNSPTGVLAEKLGSFYLGSTYDLDNDAVVGPQIHYDARDLTTHAVCVGMTGSGKTGLCVDLLEEAALDRIPAIIIDPKGDMGNLLLHFPELRAADFEPWVNEDDARRKDLSVEDFASASANLWREGLAKWGISSDRIRALDTSVKFDVYTPGSDSVRPVNILGSLRAPDEPDAEALRERIAGTTGALLGLVGIDADPVQSREMILLSVLFEHFWAKGEDIDLGLLVRSVQDPPVRKFGVFDVDAFMPEQDRFKLAMSLNNLMAAPSFAPWLSGSTLDIDNILYTSDGKPKHSIFYIAHLSEPERMFFVTLLLNALVTWMRRQPGTTSLRALLYFDEVFGFLPPVAMPPSKRPLLTLLKQARAFGLGTVLVTQNPVDIDYKALSNAGTWFIGRLQSKQDQQRLLEGLKTAAATDARASTGLAQAIGQLKSRVFVLHSVHEDGPVVFSTRWAMNYLRGPLTRTQLGGLIETDQPATPKRESERPALVSGKASSRPALPPGLQERFLPANNDAEHLVYRASVGAVATTHFLDRKYDIETEEVSIHVMPLENLGPHPNWADAQVAVVPDDPSLMTPGRHEASFADGLPNGCNTKEDARELKHQLEDWLYRNRRLSLLFNEALDLCQRPDESAAAFHSRVDLAAREQRDQAIDDAAEKLKKKIERLEERLEALARSRAEQEEQYSARKQEELLSLGETVLGFVLGRRRRLSTVATKRRMTTNARLKLETLSAKDDDIRKEIADLESDASKEAEQITLQWNAVSHEVSPRQVSPRRTDVSVDFVGVVWLPYKKDAVHDVEVPLYSLDSATS